MKKSTSFKDMSMDELRKKAIELKQTYFNFRFQHESGQLDNKSMISKTRKDIARVLTAINEKQKAKKEA